ncbi:MAG: DUF2279 domain-containing protein [Flavobacteriaceae bacterium]|nr:DUF2279 domain-containing protein [Flavobacteriaceae bacterium]NNK28138.1 DUF2279 domain-containing protein [Flavobacteriaceae bacterium]RZV65620.1 MAG: DUF2279 domain-containing protein [Flavobacteriaceae bacterium]
MPIILIFISCFSLSSQTGLNDFLKPSDTLNKSRRNAVVITEASLASLTLIGLDQLWYNDFQRSKFRTINDNNEWLLMDKMGHVMASYYVGRVGANVLDWSGVREKDQLIYGATIGLGFLTAVEVFDGFSEEWGFSWGDMLANASGTGLYIGQELLWQEQRITMKYSFHQTKYAEIRPEKLGENFLEQTLKDYNGQTYWLSANLNSFMNEQSKIPKWLNIAFGYGADGMLTGANEEADMLLFPNQDRIKQFYLSLDVDLSRIETGSRLLRTLFDVFNFIKIPAPTIELNSKGKVFFHAVYF